jgi:hypothetical protein
VNPSLAQTARQRGALLGRALHGLQVRFAAADERPEQERGTPEGSTTDDTAPPLGRWDWLDLVLVLVVAGGLRLWAAWALGDGAPFGPDGTGVEAAVHLGGHLYPAHVALVSAFGSARTVSLLTGTASVGLLWVICRQLKLSTGGAWLAACLPVLVYTSALSAGDAPALFVVLLGLLVAIQGEVLAVVGGAIALASVTVKPVALPALMLFLLCPQAGLGMLLALPLLWGWLEPLLDPRPGGGLLGTWWLGNAGLPPETPGRAADMLGSGLDVLLRMPAWAGVWLAPVAFLGAFLPARGKQPDPLVSTRLAGAVGIGGLLLVAAMMGGRLGPRYLEGAVLVLLPWAGLVVPRVFAAVLLVPTVALVTQVGAFRDVADPAAGVPGYPTLTFPEVDARSLFDDASTPGATALREEAHALARTLPEGATVEVERRPHGREGELVWPLRVLRPDVQIVLED